MQGERCKSSNAEMLPVRLETNRKSETLAACANRTLRGGSAARTVQTSNPASAGEAAYSAAWANGMPVSIGRLSSRLHSFHDPKYIRTSRTPASRSATSVLDARAPLKQ